MKGKITILFFILTVSISIYGQEPASSSQLRLQKLDATDLAFRKDTLEMNVISASRSSKKIGELPITIYVVTREEIIRNHYNSLIDILKSLPGMLVSQPGLGPFPSFCLRGRKPYWVWRLRIAPFSTPEKIVYQTVSRTVVL